jgi:hypothetical protein
MAREAYIFRSKIVKLGGYVLTDTIQEELIYNQIVKTAIIPVFLVRSVNRR